MTLIAREKIQNYFYPEGESKDAFTPEVTLLIAKSLTFQLYISKNLSEINNILYIIWYRALKC